MSAKNRQKSKNIQSGPQKQHSYWKKESVDIVFDSSGWLLQTENFMGVLENVQATPRYTEK